MTDNDFSCVNSIDELKNYNMTDIVVAVGIFDGVHSGHVKLLSSLLDLSKKLNAAPVVMTFYPHPRQLLDPENAPPQLVNLERKAELLHHYGIKALVTIPFTLEFASLSPEEFIDQCFSSESVHLRGICVGEKWRFGAKGAGGTGLLAQLARKKHFELITVQEHSDKEDHIVSSTLIRQAIAKGDIARANQLLGRHYMLIGTIEHGMGIAGTQLDHPTANLKVDSGLIPHYGVYAGFACYDGGLREPAVAAIGVAPTFNGHQTNLPRVEIHLIHKKADLYGKKLAFELIAFLREERKFESPEALKAQIEEDVKNAIDILNKESDVMEEKKKYSVIDLAEAVEVPRTTINDWLTRYAQYIEYFMQGKRRIYTFSSVEVLKAISALRNSGLSSFEIEDELAKRYAVHAEPASETGKEAPRNTTAENGKQDSSGANPGPSQENTDGMDPENPEFALIAKKQSDEIGRLVGESLRGMAEKMVQIEAQAHRTQSRMQGWFLFLLLILIAIAGSAAFALYKMQSMTEDAEKKETLIQDLNKETVLLSTKSSELQENIQTLQAGLDEQKKIFEKTMEEQKNLLEKSLQAEIARKDAEIALEREKAAAQKLESMRNLERLSTDNERIIKELEDKIEKLETPGKGSGTAPSANSPNETSGNTTQNIPVTD